MPRNRGQKLSGDGCKDYPQAKSNTLALGNLNTHAGASVYKAFPPAVARALLDKLELIYKPKQGSWLNMAEG